MLLQSSKMEEAAVLLAEDRLTDEEIAGQVGMSRRGLAKWKNIESEI
jgi:hypothetical protein